MKPAFNLIEEPWIPCLLPDNRTRDFGLLEVLVRAHEIREIFHPSPLVTTALHRLLLAILHRNFGPENLQAWLVLWQREKWDDIALESYFNRWRDRFFLFHPQLPFYQVTQMRDVKDHPVQKLAEETATGNNPTLFDHSFKGLHNPFFAATAAQYVVACQSFALGGGVSRPFNLSHAPLVRGYTVQVLGDDLFKTLALNLHSYNRHHPIPWTTQDDKPAWEREDLPEPDRNGTHPSGYLDYLTWQSRRLHLISKDGCLVSHIQVQQRMKLPEHFDRDPFMGYREDKERGVRPFPLNPDRAVWRDSHTLFIKTQEIQLKKGTISTRRPDIFNWVSRLRGGLGYRDFQFTIAGLVTDKAKVDLWRQERLPLPLAYLEDEELLYQLKVALELTEKAHDLLRGEMKRLAAFVSAPPLGGQNRQADKNEVARLVKSWAPGRLYWSRLEAPFRRLLVELPDDRKEDEDGEPVYGAQSLLEWRRLVADAALESFQEVAAGLERSVRTLKAVARVEGPFRARLNKELLPGGKI